MASTAATGTATMASRSPSRGKAQAAKQLPETPSRNTLSRAGSRADLPAFLAPFHQ